MSELDDIEQTDEREEPEEPESPDVLERAWRDHAKYVCGICERFHVLDNREAVEDHIERAH